MPKKIMGDFKKFAIKGNVIDMAVGVIIGGAFGKIVTSLVNDIIMPSVGLLMGGVDFTSLKYVITPATETVAEAAITYGNFIQSVVDFLIIAISVFVFVKIISGIGKKKEQPAPPAPPKPSAEETLLTEIRDLLKENQSK